MQKLKVAVLISGRGSNMKALIEACENPQFPAEIILVLSNKENAAGLDFAKKKSIKTCVINHKNFSSRQEFDEKMHEELEKTGVEIICLAGFMRLLSPWFVEKWSERLINIHPSLLPEFKGANAVEDAINAGAKKSGCSVHYVTEQMDEGPIIAQSVVDVLPSDDKESLAAKILQKEHLIYPIALKAVCEKLSK